MFYKKGFKLFSPDKTSDKELCTYWLRPFGSKINVRISVFSCAIVIGAIVHCHTAAF